MKNKKIIYYNEPNTDDKTAIRKQSSSKNKNLSLGKGFRQMSSNKNKNGSQSNRLWTGLQKISSSQKIKIIRTTQGFIFQKKYLIYEIQCTLSKKERQVSSTNNIASNTNIQIDQSLNQSDQDTLLLTLESSSFGITKGLVKHNFTIERDNLNYLQVKVLGYSIKNIVISNKRIEFVQLSPADNLEQQQITVVQPIRSIELSQSIRLQKINNNHKGASIMQSQNSFPKKILSFSWNFQQKVQNGEIYPKHHHKKSDLQSPSFNNSYTANQPAQNRETSKSKRMNSVIYQSNPLYKQNHQKANFNQFFKPTKQMTKVKTIQRKNLNDSGISSNGMTPKNDGKQNKREDAYGLEQINKKSRYRTKAAPNGQTYKRIGGQTTQQQQTIREQNKYMLGKKIS